MMDLLQCINDHITRERSVHASQESDKTKSKQPGQKVNIRPSALLCVRNQL